MWVGSLELGEGWPDTGLWLAGNEGMEKEYGRYYSGLSI